jgi:hypothetical protein
LCPSVFAVEAWMSSVCSNKECRFISPFARHQRHTQTGTDIAPMMSHFGAAGRSLLTGRSQPGVPV